MSSPDTPAQVRALFAAEYWSFRYHIVEFYIYFRHPCVCKHSRTLAESTLVIHCDAHMGCCGWDGKAFLEVPQRQQHESYTSGIKSNATCCMHVIPLPEHKNLWGRDTREALILISHQHTIGQEGIHTSIKIQAIAVLWKNGDKEELEPIQSVSNWSNGWNDPSLVSMACQPARLEAETAYDGTLNIEYDYRTVSRPGAWINAPNLCNGRFLFSYRRRRKLPVQELNSRRYKQQLNALPTALGHTMTRIALGCLICLG